jgi:methionine-rich copper-binding protein CopC
MCDWLERLNKKGIMKITIIVLIALLTLINSANAQTNTARVNNSIPIEMLFPQGKSKALILSFDDGNVADRHLVKLMNEYGLVISIPTNSAQKIISLKMKLKPSTKGTKYPDIRQITQI